MKTLEELARGMFLELGGDVFDDKDIETAVKALKQVWDLALLEAEFIAKVNGSKCTADDIHTLREKEGK
jgi:hypothetical protein